MWQTVLAAVPGGSDPAASLQGLLAPTGGLTVLVGLAFLVVREYRKGRQETVEQARARVVELLARISELETELSDVRKKHADRVAGLEQELGEEQERHAQDREALGQQAAQYEARLQAERDRASAALVRAYGDVDAARAAAEVARDEAWRLREWAGQHGLRPPAAAGGEVT